MRSSGRIFCNLIDTNGFEVDADGDGEEDLTALGEVTSRGVEFDIVADVTDNCVFTIAYAYNDTKITADNGTGGFRNNVGNRFANAPEHQLGIWTRYQVPSINTAFAAGAILLTGK